MFCYSHPVYETEYAAEREYDIYPPHCPQEIQESLASDTILLVNQYNCDIDQSGSAHRVRSKVKTLDWMADHDEPYVREYHISCYRENVEDDEEREVKEEK